MKTKIFTPLLKNFLDCFFLLENKDFHLNSYSRTSCMFERNRELKQLITILSASQKKSSLKLSLVVFHVEDLVSQKFLDLLISQCNLTVKVQIEIVGSPYSQQSCTQTSTLNVFFFEKKTFNFLQLKQKPLSVVFSPRGHDLKLSYSGCYSVGLFSFDIKLFIFVVAVLTSFLTQDYEKTNKI